MKKYLNTWFRNVVLFGFMVQGCSIIAQQYSAELTDSSYLLLEHNGAISVVKTELLVNKTTSSGEIILSGNFPEISFRNLQIGYKGGNELGLDGDIVPFSSTTFDLGNNVSGEHWDQVVAQNFITYVPPAARMSKAKSINNVLSQLMSLDPISFERKGENQFLGFRVEELIKHVPEVIMTKDLDYDADLKMNISKETQIGIDYNAFIPLLIKALQEQQDQIFQLSDLLKKLSQSAMAN